VKVVEQLLAYPTGIASVVRQHYLPLEVAIQLADVAVVQRLLAAGSAQGEQQAT
jgi:hypothetical protein